MQKILLYLPYKSLFSVMFDLDMSEEEVRNVVSSYYSGTTDYGCTSALSRKCLYRDVWRSNAHSTREGGRGFTI